MNKNFLSSVKSNKHFVIKKNLKKITCKNIYLFISKNTNVYHKNNISTVKSNVIPATHFLLRSFYFFKLVNFFKKNNFNISLSLKIFNKEYRNLWYLFLQEYNLNIYVLLLLNIITSYRKLLNSNGLNVKTTNLIIRPCSYFVYNDFSKNNNLNWCNRWGCLKQYILKQDVIFPTFFKKIRQPKFWILQFNETADNSITSRFVLHFLRVQRRYNKRRYSRVRSISRPPFFAGISLSSILLACFFNSSIKAVDWFTSLLIIIDVNLVLFFFIFYFLLRLYKIYNLSIFLRRRGKSRIVRILNFLFLKDFIFKLFK